jgi:hypothetical protein
MSARARVRAAQHRRVMRPADFTAASPLAVLFSLLREFGASRPGHAVRARSLVSQHRSQPEGRRRRPGGAQPDFRQCPPVWEDIETQWVPDASQQSRVCQSRGQRTSRHHLAGIRGWPARHGARHAVDAEPQRGWCIRQSDVRRGPFTARSRSARTPTYPETPLRPSRPSAATCLRTCRYLLRTFLRPGFYIPGFREMGNWESRKFRDIPEF